MGEDLLTAEQVALLFFQNMVQYFGIPTSVIHNRYPRFTSNLCTSLWKLLGLCAIAISAQHPQSGQTKCMNRTIGQILCTHWLDKDQDHWSTHVTVTEMTINSTINSSINKAPFEVLYGENLLLPVDLMFPRDSSINPILIIFLER